MSSRSIRSPGVPRAAPAIVLVELLVAALILAAAASLFLHVLLDARADLAQARRRSEALAIAADVLRGAAISWPDAPRSGKRSGYSWTLDCADPPLMKSPRLALVQCEARVRWSGALGRAQSLAIKGAWAQQIMDRAPSGAH